MRSMDASHQGSLFDAGTTLPHGLVYQPQFLSKAEEQALLAEIAQLPFREARFRQYTARRRVVHFHANAGAATADEYDDDGFSSGPLPPFLVDLQARVRQQLNLGAVPFFHALVSEYRPGTPIGWHRDKPAYGIVVGVSLAGPGRMRFRPFDVPAQRSRLVQLELEPRSIYVMQGDIRWRWQHSMLPTRSLRYSITFRTRA
jgi:alkylated DNA repair dioxygenase AlkB